MKRGIGRLTGGTGVTLPKRLAQLRRRSLRREDVELHAGRHLEAGADPDPRSDVEVPVETLRATGRGQAPSVELGDAVDPSLERAQRGAQHPQADIAILLEARRRVAGNDP